MPVYVCYRGDCAHLALERPGCFVLQDALGRDWYCAETEHTEIPPNGGQALLDLLRTQARAHAQGFSGEGSAIQLLVAADRDALARELVLGTYPRPEESRQRLWAAGWQQYQEKFATGEPTRVAVGKEGRTVEAEGENGAEAWYRVMLRAQKEDRVMSAVIHTDLPPLRMEAGAIKVGTSRVTLDAVIDEYHAGADPEAIVRAYSTLTPADVYGAIAYYLRHKEEVDAYLACREAEAEALRQEIEGQQGGSAGLREKLEARRAEQEQGHAAPRS